MTVANLREPAPSHRLLRFTLPVAILIAWEAASHAGLVDRRFLPPLEKIAARAWEETSTGTLPSDVVASFLRDLAGFVLGGALGLAAGLALGLSRTANRIAGPSFIVFRQIALFAWIPLISMWFGTGEEGKIAFIALAAFSPVLVNSWEGVRSVSSLYVEVGSVLTFGRWQSLRRILLPAAAPSIFTGLHLALIYAWLATVGAEFFLNIAPGIGGLMNQGRETFQMDLVLLCVLCLGFTGILFNILAGLAELRLPAWRSQGSDRR